MNEHHCLTVSSGEKISATVAANGFVFVPRLNCEESSEAVISRLGVIEQISHYEDVHDLIPREVTDAAQSTYSGNFGCGEFPLHTDFAHWFTPPRYLVLRCAIGADQVVTRLADSYPLLKRYGEVALGRALVRARTPINGQRPLLKLFDSGRRIFRWDQLFLVPASSHGATLFSEITLELQKLIVSGTVLKNSGDTLVIDNWRYLHGRSAVPQAQRHRKVHRAYLSVLY